MGVSPPPLASVIVPVFNNAEGLRTCLTALRALDDPACEILVADDASTEDLAPLCRTFDARHVRLPDNRGPGEARNAAARLARGEILAFTDSDCAPPVDWLARIRRALADPAVVAVAGTYGEDLSGTFFSRLRLLEARHYHIRERRLVNSFVSANFAIRKAVFDAVGGFPPLRIGEDLLLGLRLRRAGHGVLWDPDLRVSQSFRETPAAYARQQRAWSAGAFHLHLLHPEIPHLVWSVRRGSFATQLALHALFLVSLPGAVLVPAFWPLPVLAAGGLLGLNLSFLREVAQARSAAEAAAAFLAVWWVRNSAWGWGIAATAVRHPLPTLRFLARALAGAKEEAAAGPIPAATADTSRSFS